MGKAASDGLGTYDAVGAGDINSDGFDDILMGAYKNDDGSAALDDGAVYVLFGESSLSATINLNGVGVNLTILGSGSSDFLSDCSGVADVNGDGFADLVVGASRNNDGPGADDAGALYLIYGGTSIASNIPAGNADVTLLGKAAIDRLGRGSAGVGDVNNDGFPDFITGAYGNDDGGSDKAGAVYIVFGSASLSADLRVAGVGPNVTIIGKVATDYLGLSAGGGRASAGP